MAMYVAKVGYFVFELLVDLQTSKHKD